MHKVLVIGASGGMGSAIVNNLVERGSFEVVAFARTEKNLQRLFRTKSNVTVVPGDVLNLNHLRTAAEDCEIIFHAMNVPYPQWQAKLPDILKNILSVTKEQGAKLAAVDNIYAYGRSRGESITEDFPKNPHTKKGKIRLQLEGLIKDSGVPYIITHFPDFYGPYAENTLLHQTLKKVAQNKKALFVGDPTIPREYIYTPDGARTLVELALRDNSYGQNWNIPGPGVITGNEIMDILRRAGYTKGLTVIQKWMLQTIGLFSSDMREVVEMFYLNEEPVVLSGKKLAQQPGIPGQTPYETGILQTLEIMRGTITSTRAP